MNDVSREPGEISKSDSEPRRSLRGISLVVPVRNEEMSIGELIASISRQTRQPDEVILVDGGSTDLTVALAEGLTSGDPRYRIVRAGDATPGRGRNVGFAEARHDWVALTDAGIRLDPAWLERLAEVAERDPLVRVVYGNYEPVQETLFERCAALAYVPAKERRAGGRMRGPFIASALIHREVWEAVGGFPDLRAAEDLAFMERIDGQKFNVGWAPGANVAWRLQPTLARTFRRFVLYSKHNVWAGRQRHWHHGIARQYLVGLPFVVLAFAHSPWWLGAPLLGALTRVAKSIWIRREGRGLLWLLNPIQFAGVGLILAAIDLATFVGWLQARLAMRSSHFNCPGKLRHGKGFDSGPRLSITGDRVEPKVSAVSGENDSRSPPVCDRRTN
jgi:cellulose synthase/poly-beta-1,6-N-acetylglucosamine synthase-like glycosyltransferase